MKNNRGLSDVVTTVLIILLAIAAVSIVWGFVSPTLKGAGEKLSTDCISLELMPKACTITGTTAEVTYQWKAGDGLTGVNVAVSDGSNSAVADGTAPSSVLGTASQTVELGTTVDSANAMASVVAVTSTGVCSAEGAVEIPCTVSE